MKRGEDEPYDGYCESEFMIGSYQPFVPVPADDRPLVEKEPIGFRIHRDTEPRQKPSRRMKNKK